MLLLLTFALSFGSNGQAAFAAAEQFPLYGLWLLGSLGLGCFVGQGEDCGRFFEAAFLNFFN